MVRATVSRRASSARRHGQRVAGLLRAVAGLAPLPAGRTLGDLPWLQTLDEEHLRRFLEEYAEAYQQALVTDDWRRLDDMLGEWEATAEALRDPELRRLLQEERLPAHERVRLEYPA